MAEPSYRFADAWEKRSQQLAAAEATGDPEAIAAAKMAQWFTAETILMQARHDGRIYPPAAAWLARNLMAATAGFPAAEISRKAGGTNWHPRQGQAVHMAMIYLSLCEKKRLRDRSAVKRVADLFGVHRRTVARWKAQPEFEAAREEGYLNSLSAEFTDRTRGAEQRWPKLLETEAKVYRQIGNGTSDPDQLP